eukprot:GHVO01003623.1.p2 GENE.GHVO01003623.1~~GHVO01003623.1.p2  ORF type:complete len:131 (-),score=14.11 GHVO01003623.1:242-634(-)
MDDSRRVAPQKKTRSLHDADDTTGQTTSCVTRGGAQFMTSKTKVIRVSMNHHGSANDRVRSSQSDLLVSNVNLSDAIVTSGYVAKISGMSDFSGGGAMGLAIGVEVSSCTDASICVVTKLMHMESVLTSG